MLDGKAVSGRVGVTANRHVEDQPLQLAFGRRLEFFARLRGLRNYQNLGVFDRVARLHRCGIYITATVRPYTPLLPPEGRSGSAVDRSLWWLGSEAKLRFEALVANADKRDSIRAAVLQAMLLGDRSAIERQTQLEFQRIGTYHALIASDLHAVLVALAVFALFRLTATRF